MEGEETLMDDDCKKENERGIKDNAVDEEDDCRTET
jgi:hypothetical protein